jgi:cytochrome c-type biogenesis protein CcmE
VRHEGDALDFSVADRAGSRAIPVVYTGTVPDPFREGREVIVTVEKQGGRYVGERNSLITKCPSKYKTAPASESQNY